jgi:hypothetical protein
VQSEAALLRELLYANRQMWLPKILPVILPGHTVNQIPLFLQPYTASRFDVTAFDTDGAQTLLRVIWHQPGHIAPEVSSEEPAHPASTDLLPSHRPTGQSRVVNQVNGPVIGGKIIQTDTVTGNINL